MKQIKTPSFIFFFITFILKIDKSLQTYIIPQSCAQYAKVESGAFHDGNDFKVWLNNQEISLNAGRGWNIVVFDKNDASIIEFQTFDTFGQSSHSNLMMDFLDSIEEGVPVAFGIKDEATQSINVNVYKKLQQFQFPKSQSISYRDSFAGIGIKNSNIDYSNSQVFSKQNNGPAISYGCIVFCHKKCDGCLNQKDNCINCVFHFTRNMLAPNCYCNKGYYDDGSSLGCRLCSNKCQIDCIEKPTNCCNYRCGSCQGTIDNCTECSHASRHNPPTCDCKTGYYESGPFKTCESCVFPCIECSSNNVCISCISGFKRTGAPTCSCQDGYYSNGQPNCIKCQFPCLTCESQNQCKICVQRDNQNSSPACTCQDGFFENNNQICEQCSSKCSTCKTKDECLECADGYYMDIKLNECQKCIYPCQKCFSQNYCTDCVSNINRVEGSQNCDCKQGYYDNGFQCDVCAIRCLTCQNQNECLTCKLTYPQRDINRNCQCIDGYEDDLEGNCVQQKIIQELEQKEQKQDSTALIVFIVLGLILVICLSILSFIVYKKAIKIYQQSKNNVKTSQILPLEKISIDKKVEKILKQKKSLQKQKTVDVLDNSQQNYNIQSNLSISQNQLLDQSSFQFNDSKQQGEFLNNYNKQKPATANNNNKKEIDFNQLEKSVQFENQSFNNISTNNLVINNYTNKRDIFIEK